MTQTISLPNNWRPRDYQREAWEKWKKDCKRLMLVWHRRAGKDDFCLHGTACKLHERVGSYWHMLPKYSQGRKAIWTAVNPHTGKRRIDEAFPPELRKAVNNQEMFIEFKNGSTWQVIGSDQYNSIVGASPAGVVFSEWALADPAAWAFIRPMLIENKGWAVFITTPRGRNHAYDMFEARNDRSDWFMQKLTVEQTKVLTSEQITNEKYEYQGDYGPDQGEALWLQEYFCSFTAPVLGAYYAKLLDEAETKGRITGVPHDPAVEVMTFWDLGHADATAIWFVQIVGREIRVIDFYENSGQALDHYARVINAKPYNYASHNLPHDGKSKQLQTGKSCAELLESMGLRNVEIVPQIGVDNGINAARLMIPRCWFDAEKCKTGLDALRMYRTEWDKEKKVFNPTPVHDWSSHAADAFRMMAVGMKETSATSARRIKKIHNPFTGAIV